MCCERLVCASCAGHVVDARCPSCAASRARVHGGGAALYVPDWLAVLAVLLVTATLLLAALTR